MHMVKDIATDKDTKQKFVITGEYSSLKDFLIEARTIINQILTEQIKIEYAVNKDKEFLNIIGRDHGNTVYPTEEPHTVTIYV